MQGDVPPGDARPACVHLSRWLTVGFGLACAFLLAPLGVLAVASEVITKGGIPWEAFLSTRHSQPVADAEPSLAFAIFLAAVAACFGILVGKSALAASTSFSFGDEVIVRGLLSRRVSGWSEVKLRFGQRKGLPTVKVIFPDGKVATTYISGREKQEIHTLAKRKGNAPEEDRL